MKKFDLEDRFINYAIIVSNITEMVESSKFGNHISGQLIRCGSSPPLNYGEAQSAESRKDFIHKMKIILKELKESRVCLKIIEQKPLTSDITQLLLCKKETEEIIAITFKSIETAKMNMKNDGYYKY